MRLLITGNMGYVGPVVVGHLRQRHPNAELIGYDSGLFAGCLTAGSRAPETLLNRQHFGDVRDLPSELLTGVDAVVHLAAVSNDPIGDRFEAVTDAINRHASLRLASLAAASRVRHFVYASSCSVYGAAGAQARRESDAINPLTAYARSKVMTEQGLRQMNPNGMTITCLRFATACGMSARLRLDLVLNDFAACALTSGTITVLSDGTPWRPLIDGRDMARAIEWAIVRKEADGGRMLVINVGSVGGAAGKAFDRDAFARVAESGGRVARRDAADRHVRDVSDYVTLLTQPQAKVGFFAVKKKPRIKAAQRGVNFTPENHARSDDPGDFSR